MEARGNTPRDLEDLSPEAILEEWKRAFESGDPESLASLYTTDAYFEVSDLSIQAYGRSSILDAFRAVMQDSTEREINWRLPLVGRGIMGVEYEISWDREIERGVAILGVSGSGIVFDKRFIARWGRWMV